MPLIPNTMLRRIATLPLATYQAGETVLVAGTKTGRLLILRKGAVAIEKEGTVIAKVAESGAVFGELSALLNSAAHCRRASLGTLRVSRRARRAARRRSRRTHVCFGNPGTASQPR